MSYQLNNMLLLQYEAITVPYPKDKETPDIDQKEKELVRLWNKNSTYNM